MVASHETIQNTLTHVLDGVPGINAPKSQVLTAMTGEVGGLGRPCPSDYKESAESFGS